MLTASSGRSPVERCATGTAERRHALPRSIVLHPAAIRCKCKRPRTRTWTRSTEGGRDVPAGHGLSGRCSVRLHAIRGHARRLGRTTPISLMCLHLHACTAGESRDLLPPVRRQIRRSWRPRCAACTAAFAPHPQCPKRHGSTRSLPRRSTRSPGHPCNQAYNQGIKSATRGHMQSTGAIELAVNIDNYHCTRSTANTAKKKKGQGSAVCCCSPAGGIAAAAASPLRRQGAESERCGGIGRCRQRW